MATAPATERSGLPVAAETATGSGCDVAILLFRADLRLDDHAALARALALAPVVVPVFCFDPRLFGPTLALPGLQRLGPNAGRLLLDAVADLRARLRHRGADLVVRRGAPEHVVPQLARAVRARHVVLHRDYAPTLLTMAALTAAATHHHNSATAITTPPTTTMTTTATTTTTSTSKSNTTTTPDNNLPTSPLLSTTTTSDTAAAAGSDGSYVPTGVERALAAALAREGVDMHAVGADTLYADGDLPFNARAVPADYSAFRDAVHGRALIRAPLDAPDRLHALPSSLRCGDLPTLAQLGIAEPPQPPPPPRLIPAAGAAARQDQYLVGPTRGGEREALGRLAMFVRAQCRKGVSTGRSVQTDYALRVAPWLRYGCVSARRVFFELGQCGMSEADALESETYFNLVWRDYALFRNYAKMAKEEVAMRGAVGRRRHRNARGEQRE